MSGPVPPPFLMAALAREADPARRALLEKLLIEEQAKLAEARAAAAAEKRPKADPANPNHIAAPMPGKISTVAVTTGQKVHAGDRLLSIEAMKMETAVYSPSDATVAEVLASPNTVVEAKDLLVQIVP